MDIKEKLKKILETLSPEEIDRLMAESLAFKEGFIHFCELVHVDIRVMTIETITVIASALQSTDMTKEKFFELAEEIWDMVAEDDDPAAEVH